MRELWEVSIGLLRHHRQLHQKHEKITIQGLNDFTILRIQLHSDYFYHKPSDWFESIFSEIPKKKPTITAASAQGPFSLSGNCSLAQSFVFAHRQPWVTKKKLAGSKVGWELIFKLLFVCLKFLGRKKFKGRVHFGAHSYFSEINGGLFDVIQWGQVLQGAVFPGAEFQKNLHICEIAENVFNASPAD